MCVYVYIHTHFIIIYIYIYIYKLRVARYMYSYRTVTVRTSRFGTWGLTTNTGYSPPIQKGASAVMQCCLKTASWRTANAASYALETVTMCRFWTRLSQGLTKACALNCLGNGALCSCILPLSFDTNISEYFHVCDVTYLNAKLLFIM